MADEFQTDDPEVMAMYLAWQMTQRLYSVSDHVGLVNGKSMTIDEVSDFQKNKFAEYLGAILDARRSGLNPGGASSTRR